MKRNEMRKLALLGMAAGLLAINQSGLEAAADENSINLDYVIAKPSCKAHGGCSVTAMRDVNTDEAQDEEELEEEEDADEGSHEGKKDPS